MALLVTLSAVGLAVGERPAPALPDDHSTNMVHVANLRDDATEDKSRALWSDIAFWGSTMAVFDGNVGSESGFRILDISTPSAPKLLHNVRRPGSTSHLALWDHLVILSADADLNGRACPDPKPDDDKPSTDDCKFLEARPFSGLIVYDIGGPAPVKLVEKPFTCGHLGHNFTVLPDLEHLDGSGRPAPRLLLYVSGSACQDDEDDEFPPRTFLPVYELPIQNPTSLKQAREPVRGDPAWVEVTPLGGAHDMTVFVPGKLAFVGDPFGGFLLFDITDPLNPVRRAFVPAGTDVLNVNANHSGAFSWDGKTLVVTEEAQGGAGATATDDESLGRLRFYDISDVKRPQLRSVHKVPASRASYVGPHSVHQVNVLPTKPVQGVRRNILSASWYRGGSSLVDFTNPADPREIAHYVFRNELKPDGTVGIHSFTTASFWYNGFVYATNAPEDGIADAVTTGHEMGRSRGLDVFRVVDPLTGDDLVRSTYRLGRMNYSTQEGRQGYAEP